MKNVLKTLLQRAPHRARRDRPVVTPVERVGWPSLEAPEARHRRESDEVPWQPEGSDDPWRRDVGAPPKPWL